MLLLEAGATPDDCHGMACETPLAESVTAIPTPASNIDLDGNGVPDLCQMRCGDLDLSGSIDEGDLALLLTMIGTEPVLGLGDLDSDAVIDEADTSLLLQRMSAEEAATDARRG